MLMPQQHPPDARVLRTTHCTAETGHVSETQLRNKAARLSGQSSSNAMNDMSVEIHNKEHQHSFTQERWSSSP